LSLIASYLPDLLNDGYKHLIYWYKNWFLLRAIGFSDGLYLDTSVYKTFDHTIQKLFNGFLFPISTFTVIAHRKFKLYIPIGILWINFLSTRKTLGIKIRHQWKYIFVFQPKNLGINPDYKSPFQSVMSHFEGKLLLFYWFIGSYFCWNGNSDRSFIVFPNGTIIVKTNSSFKHYNYICDFLFLIN
jgi:hypothetical protein